MPPHVLVASAQPRSGIPLLRPAPWDWLVRLRWTAVIGQTITILAVRSCLKIPLPVPEMLTIVTLVALSNIALPALRDRVPGDGANWIAGVLLLDALALTGLLACSGGPHNPFGSFYLIHITMAAMLVSGLWTGALCGWCSLCYAALFFLPSASGHLAHGMLAHTTAHAETNLHLQGMLVSFVLTAAAISYFVIQLNASIRQQQRDLARAQSLAAETERSAALTALAAGVAHELGSPLASIAVASHELTRTAYRSSAAQEFLPAARFIREEVDRCRVILDQINPDAIGDSAPDVEGYALSDCFKEMRSRLLPEQLSRIAIHDASEGTCLHLPRVALIQSLVSLVQNGLEASSAGSTVEVRAAATSNDSLDLRVIDPGCGMDPDFLSRLGSPFFTTKGSGKGLGIFLVRLFVQQVGGSMEIDSEKGRGTTVRLRLPTVPLNTPSPT
ncbi:MAG: hypothetical protein JNN07_00065 [Verrucomicrobiales bacterium]|nr:hypothetical protein [Verrucomicrobiales bacterium]